MCCSAPERIGHGVFRCEIGIIEVTFVHAPHIEHDQRAQGKDNDVVNGQQHGEKRNYLLDYAKEEDAKHMEEVRLGKKSEKLDKTTVCDPK